MYKYKREKKQEEEKKKNINLENLKKGKQDMN